MADHPETTALRMAKAATEGPYTPEPADSCGTIVVDVRAGRYVVAFGANPADAAHIAHAHPGRVRAWLGAVARLRLIVAQGHMSWCKGKGAFGDGDDCTCGHDLDLAALAAVDAEG